MTTLKSLLFLGAVLAASAFPAQAEVVRCTDASGRITYTDGACPSGSQSSRQVPIAEPPPPSAEDARRPYTPPPVAAPPQVPSTPATPPVAGGQAPGLAIIPRSVEEPAPPPPSAPPVYGWSPDPYYDVGRPIVRPPRPLRPVDPGPPPGQRPCANLAGIKRSNC